MADAADGSDGSADAGADATDGGNDGFSIGPVFKGLGVAAGLAYTQVSSYLSVPPGAYDVRIVAPNSPNCRTALAGLPDTTLDVVAVGTYSTIAAIGVINSDAGQDFQLRRYLDERAVTAGSGKLRFIHAAPGVPNVDVGVGTAESFIAIFDNVPFGGVGVGTGVDVAGYIETPPVSNQTLGGSHPCDSHRRAGDPRLYAGRGSNLIVLCGGRGGLGDRSSQGARLQRSRHLESASVQLQRPALTGC